MRVCMYVFMSYAPLNAIGSLQSYQNIHKRDKRNYMHKKHNSGRDEIDIASSLRKKVKMTKSAIFSDNLNFFGNQVVFHMNLYPLLH